MSAPPTIPLINRQALKARLQRMLTRGATTYRADGALPIYATLAWAATTVVAYNEVRYSGNSVYAALKGGTTGSVAPTGTAIQIADGTVIWAYMGYRLPVAYTNSLAVVVDQLFYNSGKQYRVSAPGSFAATGSGPTTASAGTDGSVSYVYVGEQTLPLVSAPATGATSGLSSQVAWNGSAATVLGGTIVRNGANAWGNIVQTSVDGNAYTSGSGGNGGSVFTQTDAPSLDDVTISAGSLGLWIDGQLAGIVILPAGSSYTNLNFAGVAVPRKVRLIRVSLPSNVSFFGFYGKPADTFSPYISVDPFKAVLIGDSFDEGGAAVFEMLGYAQRLGRGLGIDDFRCSGLGSTGILQTANPRTNYVTRFTQDVISQNPDLVIIQNSQNDGAQSYSSVIAAEQALISKVRNEIPNALLVIMGLWNNRAPVSAGAYASLETSLSALAAANNVPYIDWASFLSEGGYVGTVSGTGSSYNYTTSDGTHPTPAGAYYRAERLVPVFGGVWAGL